MLFHNIIGLLYLALVSLFIQSTCLWDWWQVIKRYKVVLTLVIFVYIRQVILKLPRRKHAHMHERTHIAHAWTSCYHNEPFFSSRKNNKYFRCQ